MPAVIRSTPSAPPQEERYSDDFYNQMRTKNTTFLSIQPKQGVFILLNLLLLALHIFLLLKNTPSLLYAWVQFICPEVNGAHPGGAA